MKLKQRPEDFVVRELSEPALVEKGPYAVYRLRKRGIGTIEAATRIAALLGVERRAIGVGGLKDKWAETEQAITIQAGPPKDLEERKFSLAFLGYAQEPMRRGGFRANGFSIRLRDLSEGDVTHLKRALEEIGAFGLPNYFDSQRFGSLKDAGDFIARRLIRGDFEGALRLALATPNRDDRARTRELKESIRDGWGRWDELARKLPRKAYERRIVHRLAKHPRDLARAFELIDKNLRLLYLSAYQSYLWNRCLAALVSAHSRETFTRRYEAGEFVFYRTLPGAAVARLRPLRIEYVRKGVVFEDAEVSAIMERLLAEEGVNVKDLRLHGLRSTFFGRGRRPALVFPANLGLEGPAADELNAGRLKAVLSFELESGSYATILIKRIFH